MAETDRHVARIKELEVQLAEKDRLIADLVKRHIESRDHELERRVASLEQALRKWMTAALKGKLDITNRNSKK